MNLKEQHAILSSSPVDFAEKIHLDKKKPLHAIDIKTFQINVGKVCNQACHHCHVDASPIRTESMSEAIVKKCLDILSRFSEFEIVDITGGAPEINPHFRFLVTESRRMGKHVIDRCNLTILEESGFEDLAEFLRDNQVEIIASLPHYAERRTDAQRGKGVFQKSIAALKKLNTLGYGKDIPLHLVYNPTGIFLTANQAELEREFKESLKERLGIVFTHLYCINNIPINRFLHALVRKKKFEEYMNILMNAYNPSTLEGLMCRHQISVDYLGNIYDCDFNQMLDMKISPVGHIDEWDMEKIRRRFIRTANHCFGCTAGAGSSCGGELTPQSS